MRVPRICLTYKSLLCYITRLCVCLCICSWFSFCLFCVISVLFYRICLFLDIILYDDQQFGDVVLISIFHMGSFKYDGKLIGFFFFLFFFFVFSFFCLSNNLLLWHEKSGSIDNVISIMLINMRTVYTVKD